MKLQFSNDVVIKWLGNMKKILINIYLSKHYTLHSLNNISAIHVWIHATRHSSLACWNAKAKWFHMQLCAGRSRKDLAIAEWKRTRLTENYTTNRVRYFTFSIHILRSIPYARCTQCLSVFLAARFTFPHYATVASGGNGGKDGDGRGGFAR